MKVKEALDKINKEKFDSVYESVYEVLDDAKPVAEGLKPDRHRWYTVSTNVYKLEDGFIGITGVTDVKGDTDYCDCECPATASEYEKFTTISYRPKKN